MTSIYKSNNLHVTAIASEGLAEVTVTDAAGQSLSTKLKPAQIATIASKVSQADIKGRFKSAPVKASQVKPASKAVATPLPTVRNQKGAKSTTPRKRA